MTRCRLVPVVGFAAIYCPFPCSSEHFFNLLVIIVNLLECPTKSLSRPLEIQQHFSVADNVANTHENGLSATVIHFISGSVLRRCEYTRKNDMSHREIVKVTVLCQ